MKRIYSITTSTLLLLTMFISCTNDVPEPVIVDGNDGIYAFSLTTSLDDAPFEWAPANMIGISAYNSTTGEIYSSRENLRYYYMTTENLFYPLMNDYKIYRPLAGHSVDIVAFHPYKATVENKYVINLDNQSSQMSVDFLYSDNLRRQTSAMTKADLIFQHALSKIIITSTPGDYLSEEHLHNMTVSIDGTHPHAAFDVRNAAISPTAPTASIVMNTTTDGITSEAVILPGSYTEAGITVRLANSEVFHAAFPKNQTFLPGTRYYYNLRINRTELVLESKQIQDWSGIDTPPDTSTATSKSYKIGDFFPNPDDVSSAIGIVYWTLLDSDGKEGKILSLDVARKAWGYMDIHFLNTSIVNGHLNITIISAIDPGYNDHPAFLWCAQKGSGWFLPSRYELHIMKEQWLSNRELINNNLILAGGVPLTDNDVYFSSTGCRNAPGTQAEAYSFFDASWPSNDKTTELPIRAVRVF